MALSNETRIFSDRRYPPLPAWRLVWQGNEPANKVLSAMPPELQRHIVVMSQAQADGNLPSRVPGGTPSWSSWVWLHAGNAPANKVLSAMPPELQRHIIVAGELIPARATRVTEEGVVTP